MDKHLSESEKFKVYSISENIYLKDKKSSRYLDVFEKTDRYIDHHYGDPEGALISPTEDYVVVVGHGISIYPLNDKYGIEQASLFNESENQMYTNGVHIEYSDQPSSSWDAEGPFWLWFRFVSANVIYKMNAKTKELVVITPGS